MDKITFRSDTLRKYFPRSYTPQQMEQVILKLLEDVYKRQVFSYVGLALLIYTLFRMFSRHTARRTAENAWFWNRTAKLRTSFSRARVRFQNRKEYKYFRCPKCHAWLKLKRGSGEGTLTCGKCKHAFKAKA